MKRGVEDVAVKNKQRCFPQPMLTEKSFWFVFFHHGESQMPPPCQPNPLLLFTRTEKRKSLLRKYERELKRLRAELEERSRNLVDKRQLLFVEGERRRAEADKMVAIRALEVRFLLVKKHVRVLSWCSYY